MSANNTGFLIAALQSVLSGKEEGDFSEMREVLGYIDHSEFSRFLDGCQQLVRIGEYILIWILDVQLERQNSYLVIYRI